VNTPSKSALVVILSSVTLAAGGWFLIIPRLTAVVTEFTRVDLYNELTGKQNAEQAKKTRAATLATYVQAINERKAIVDPLLPLEENPVDLTIQIDVLAKSQGINVSALSVTGGVAGPAQRTSSAQAAQSIPVVPGTKTSSVSITVNGTYEQVRTFILSLPSINRIIQIGDIVMSGSDQGVTATISANAYLYETK
jgi:Tfp pilus assembly protein PilO